MVENGSDRGAAAPGAPSRGDILADKTGQGAHSKFGRHIYWKDPELDFFWSWMLGGLFCGGGTSGELYYAASRVDEGEPETFISEFTELGARVERLGDEALRSGHAVSAREAFLRANRYYRLAISFMYPREERHPDSCRAAERAFRKAAPLLDPPMEIIEIPYEGKSLPGYFWSPDASGAKRKTLVAVGGGESFVEDLYFGGAQSIVARGYNWASFDLPGQGSLPHRGMFFDERTEEPMKAVLDLLLMRPDVDAERLAVSGYSLGGYMAPRAAAFDKRIKALVANSLFVYFAEMAKLNLEARMKSGAEPGIWASRVNAGQFWRFGCDPADIAGFMKKTSRFTFDPRLITAPTLSISGAGEYSLSKKWVDAALEGVSNSRKKLAIGPVELGAALHCLLDNVSYCTALTCDWLDEVLS